MNKGRRTMNKNTKRTKRIRYRGALAPDKYLSCEQVRTVKAHLAKRLKAAVKPSMSSVGDSRRAAVNQFIFLMLLNTGLRAAELCALQMRDLPGCHGKCVVYVRSGKGRVARAVYISAATADMITLFIRWYRKNAKPRSPLLVSEEGRAMGYYSLYSKMRIIGRHVGFRLTPHMCRHTYGVRFYNTVQYDLLFLRDQMGHKSIETTAIYARTDNEKRRRQIEMFKP